MRLNIGAIAGRRGDSFKVDKEYKADFLESVPQVHQVCGPLRAELTVTNTGQGYLAVGELTAPVELICGRCLRPFETTLTAPLEAEFLNEPSEASVAPWDEQLLVEGQEIDLAESIEGSLLISLPMKAVCDPSCPGLCPTCGTALVEGGCSCRDADLDLRLAPLAELLKQNNAPERREDDGSTKTKTFQGKG